MPVSKWSFVVLLALLGSSATAQEPASPSRDVIVTGRREVPRAVARRFATNITRAVDAQLARVRWPICPAVLGIDPVLAGQIADRIRAVARAAGAPVAGAGCRDANSTVIVATDPVALLADIRLKHPGWLTGLRAAEVGRLIAETGPARAWQINEVLNEDGRAMRGSAASSGSTAPTTNPGSTADLSLPSAPVLQAMGSSILQPPTQQAISASFLVLDARATLGKTPTQIADYAAMRLLAATQPPVAGGDTVLTLFSVAEAPAALTVTDAAYLRALYHTPVTEKASARLDSIAGQMARGGR